MPSQQTLWDAAGLPTINTKLAAAASIAPLKSTHLRRVLEFIDAAGELGAIDEEIAIGVGLRESTARARRVELRDGGQVRDSGRFRNAIRPRRHRLDVDRRTSDLKEI